MKKTLTVVLIALLSVACLVTIIIGLSGNTKTAANPDIAEPVSTRIIEAPKGDANAADAAHDLADLICGDPPQARRGARAVPERCRVCAPDRRGDSPALRLALSSI